MHLRLLALERRLSRSLIVHSRSYASSERHSVPNGADSTNPNRANNEETKDFRPSWVYTGSHVLTYSLMPAVGLYCVFFVDWGDREHVFMPPRRWLARQKARFFSLTPAEQALAKADEVQEKQP